MTLRDYQLEAVMFLGLNPRALVKAPAGSGKTLIAAHAASHMACRGWKIGWLANTVEQCQQAVKAIESVGGPEDCDFKICCAAGEPDFSDRDIIIVDECHHLPAVTWLQAIANSNAKVIWGFSATPYGDDPVRNAVLELLFPVMHSIDRARLEAAGHLEKGKVWMHDVDTKDEFNAAIDAEVAVETADRCRRFPALYGDPRYLQLSNALGQAWAKVVALQAGIEAQKCAAEGMDCSSLNMEVRAIVQRWLDFRAARRKYVYDEHEKKVRWQITQEYTQKNEKRNAKICSLCNVASEARESVLLLVGSIEHGALLASAIPGAALVHSKISKKLRFAHIDAFRAGTLPVLAATSLADEGLDVPRASVLVLAAGGRSAGRLEQRAGRVLRPHADKPDGGVIHDFLDRGATFAYAQALARRRVYERLGYCPEIVGV